jgi:hypothetical protein
LLQLQLFGSFDQHHKSTLPQFFSSQHHHVNEELSERMLCYRLMSISEVILHWMNLNLKIEEHLHRIQINALDRELHMNSKQTNIVE